MQQIRRFCHRFSSRLPVVFLSRNFIGTTAATLCAARCMHLKNISCDPSAVTLPRLQLADTSLQDSPISPSGNILIVPKRESIIDHAIRWFDFLNNFLKSILRSIELGFIFSPVILTSPLLLSKREDYQIIWWTVLKYSVKSAGACFTKLAQVCELIVGVNNSYIY